MVFYLLKIKNSNKYKYGITEDLKNRMYQYKTHNPDEIEIVHLIKKSNLAIYLERLCFFNNYFKRIRGEWIELNKKEELLLIKFLNETIKKHNNKFLDPYDKTYNDKFQKDIGLFECIFKNIVEKS